MRPTKPADEGVHRSIPRSVHECQLHAVGFTAVQPDAAKKSSTQQLLANQRRNRTAHQFRLQFIYLTCIYTYLSEPPLTAPCLSASLARLFVIVPSANNRESHRVRRLYTASFLFIFWFGYLLGLIAGCIFSFALRYLKLMAGRGMPGKMGEGSEKEGNVHIGIIKPGAHFPKSGSWANVRSEPFIIS